jgi:gas vesicle protein
LFSAFSVTFLANILNSIRKDLLNLCSLAKFITMKDSGKIIVALLAGAAVGAAVALLLAPSSGAELREDISDYANDLANAIRDKAESAANSIREYGNSTLERSKSKFRSTVNDLSSYRDGVTDKVRSKASDLVDAGRDMVEQAKSRVKGSANDVNDSIQNV